MIKCSLSHTQPFTYTVVLWDGIRQVRQVVFFQTILNPKTNTYSIFEDPYLQHDVVGSSYSASAGTNRQSPRKIQVDRYIGHEVLDIQLARSKLCTDILMSFIKKKR